MKKKKGIGGLLFILTVAISTATLCSITKLGTMNNTKYIVNSTAYFVSNKTAINLYNTNAPSGTYDASTGINRINTSSDASKNRYYPITEMNSILKEAYEDRLKDSNGNSGYCNTMVVNWNKDTKTAVVNFGPVKIGDFIIYPNEQSIVIEK